VSAYQKKKLELERKRKEAKEKEEALRLAEERRVESERKEMEKVSFGTAAPKGVHEQEPEQQELQQGEEVPEDAERTQEQDVRRLRLLLQ